jgi:hypothetical protein
VFEQTRARIFHFRYRELSSGVGLSHRVAVDHVLDRYFRYARDTQARYLGRKVASKLMIVKEPIGRIRRGGKNIRPLFYSLHAKMRLHETCGSYDRVLFGLPTTSRKSWKHAKQQEAGAKVVLNESESSRRAQFGHNE